MRYRTAESDLLRDTPLQELTALQGAGFSEYKE